MVYVSSSQDLFPFLAASIKETMEEFEGLFPSPLAPCGRRVVACARTFARNKCTCTHAHMHEFPSDAKPLARAPCVHRSLPPSSAPLPLGFTFSFPVEQSVREGLVRVGVRV